MLLRSSRSIMLLSSLLTIGLSSCGISKVAQCNSLSGVINQTQGFKAEFENEMNGFTQQASKAKGLNEIKGAATQYITVVNKLTGSLDGIVTSLKAVELPDKELTKYRDEYANLLSGSSQDLKATNEAMQLLADVKSMQELPKVLTQFQEKANTPLKNLQEVSTKETALITNINSYCGAEAPSNK